MNRGNFFRQAIFAALSVIFLLGTSIAHAEIYIGEGKYIMSEGENLGVSKERAKADALRNASEKAGVYVKAYSRSKNFELEEDIIETMTANILKLIEEPHFYPLETVDNLEGVLIRVTVKAQIDDSDIMRWLNKDDKEKSTLVSQNEALRKANEEQARQIEELKRQLANNPQDKEKITQKFEEEDKIFLSNQKVEEGWNIAEKGDFNGAKNLFDEAISLNPNNSNAYFGRGTAYGKSGQYERAIQDFNKAIELNPNLSEAYYNRGCVYDDLKQYERAIQDYDKAIQLNPNDAEAYNNRGLDYAKSGNFNQALNDINKYIQLVPNNAMAYQIRGLCYQALGDKAKAQADFAKAKQLGYKG